MTLTAFKGNLSKTKGLVLYLYCYILLYLIQYKSGEGHHNTCKYMYKKLKTKQSSQLLTKSLKLEIASITFVIYLELANICVQTEKKKPQLSNQN